MDDCMQRQRALAAVRAKRYRDRKKQGHVPQPVTQHSSEQYQTLFSTPYVELSEKDKALVRYHRRQARKQAHRAPSSSSPLPQSHQPSLQSPSQSESSITVLTTAAELSSTGTTLSTAPSSLLAEQPAITTTTTTSTTLPCVLHSSTPLVHPYEEAVTRSQGAPDLQSIPTPSLTTPPQQWKSSHNFLYNQVLVPMKRYQHMIEIHPPGTTNTSTISKYLAVSNIDTKQDIFPNSHGNIIQEMLVSVSMSMTTSSTSTPAQQLKQVLPFTTTTHTQLSYSHQNISAPRSPPIVSITTLSQSESYKRIILASTASSPTTNKHIFTPSININCVKDPIVRKRLIDIARDVQQHYRQTIPHKHQELECDHVFSSPLDGFGISGLQVYIKSGECVTWLHDELLWCAALNYMLKESQGCALWIAVGLHDLKQVMSLADIEKLLITVETSKQNILEVGTLLDTLIKSQIPIEYVMQKPGQLVSSPPGNGAAHFVYSYGTLMTQLAWNYSFTIPGAVQCLSYWGIDDSHDHLAVGNTSMATRTVLPLFTMQLHGYELGLMDQLGHYQELIKKLQSLDKKIKITHDLKLSSKSCDICLHRQD